MKHQLQLSGFSGPQQRQRAWLLPRTLLLGLFVFGLVAQAAPIVLGTNAVVNGDFETPGSGGAIPGWVVNNGFPEIVLYGTGTFPSSSSPGGSVGGSRFFAGGPASSFSRISQLIDVSNITALIDAGLVQYSLSAYLGGFQSQNDDAHINIWYVGSGGAQTLGIDSTLLGPDAVGRGGQTGLFLRSLNHTIPAGTLAISLEVIAGGFSGYNDGYADNISFIATASASPTPEPSTWSMMAGALGSLLVARRRRALRVATSMAAPEHQEGQC